MDVSQVSISLNSEREQTSKARHRSLLGNIAANFAARAFGFVTVFVFVPIYLHFLGPEAFGLVGFYSTLLGIQALADLGLSATLTRELARLAAQKQPAEAMRDTVHTLGTASMALSLVLAIGCWIASPLLAANWLNLHELQTQEVTATLRVMALAIAVQIPAALYSGGLMGLQRQVHANALFMVWGLIRSLGSVAVLWLFSPTILAFSWCQLAAAVFYFGAVRHCLWRSLPQGQAPSRFRWEVFRRTWRYASGMAGQSLVSTSLMQADKIVVSKMLSLEALGSYSVASTLASLPVLLSGPIVQAVFPRLTALIEAQRTDEARRLYQETSEWVAMIVVPTALTIAVFSQEVMLLWTGSEIVAQQTRVLVALLVIGQLIQSLTTTPYYLALSGGHVGLALKLGVAPAVLWVPLLGVLVASQGVTGGGMAWLLVNVVVTPPFLVALHRRILPGQLAIWTLRCVAYPLVVALPCVFLGQSLMVHASSKAQTLCVLGLTWLVATVATAMAMKFRANLNRSD